VIKRLIFCLVLLPAPVSAAEEVSFDTESVVFLTKNTNSNQVHYGVRVDQNCRPVKRKPLRVFWLMLEKGPAETAGLMFWERPGYGVRQPKQVHQDTDSGNFEFVIRGVPERALTMQTFTSAAGCRARVTTRIADQEAVLQRIDIEVSGWANVHKVEIFGLSLIDGKPLNEITHQD